MPSLRRRPLLAVPLLVAPLMALPRVAVAQEDTVVRGPTRPQRLAVLGTQADGVVREVAVAEGDRVKEGDLLLRLDDEVQAARINLARVAAEAEGELRQTEVQHHEALAVLVRTQQAAGRGAATEWEVRQARARVEITKAAFHSAEERRRIEQQRLELERAQQTQLAIRAPFDGIVTRVDTVAGATLTRADRPLTVADLAVLEAVLYVPAEAWKVLRIGQAYPLLLSAPVARTLEARLRHMDPVMDAASGRFRAVFTIANPDASLPAGLEAELDLRTITP